MRNEQANEANTQARMARIMQMERVLNSAVSALHALDEAIERYRSMERDIAELVRYYDSGLWFMDYQADERGEIPRDVRRGVLSEDGVYNFLADQVRVMAELKELCRSGALERAAENDQKNERRL